ncbi:MAG: NAD-dependent epimerase/dehydratase family protein [Gemmatimonadetes bacterium]|nr:NAD-dependent epimerase/dehydratase family protein [Gemmatimonadota bacterium]
MHVTITGGTGFIGTRLAERCVERGDTVIALGQKNTSAESANLARLEDAGVDVRMGSVTDSAAVERAVAGSDVVFHLAAAMHEMNVPDGHYHEVNIEGTRNVLAVSARAGIRRVVHGSTIGVYGITHGRVDETTPCVPTNIYGRTKLEAERVVLEAAERVPLVVVRIPEIYGPGDRRLLKMFRGLRRGRFPMVGRGRNLHPLLFVDDLIDGLWQAAESDAVVGEVVLFAGPTAITTTEMVRTVAESVGVKGPRFRLPMWPFLLVGTVLEKTLRPMGIQPPLHTRRLDFFRKGFEVSADKARRLLGFEPHVSFRDGAKATADWYRSQGLLT